MTKNDFMLQIAPFLKSTHIHVLLLLCYCTAEWYGKTSEILSSSLPMNNWKVQVSILDSLSSIYARY